MVGDRPLRGGAINGGASKELLSWFPVRSSLRWVAGKGYYDGHAAADWIPTVVENLVAALDPINIVLFGSMARGDERPDSDMDLLVIVPRLEPDTKLARCIEARRAVTAPVPLDLLVVDATELAERGDLPGILRVACREGKVLSARPA